MQRNKKIIDIKNKVILVTGACGFIGANLITKFLENNKVKKIIGIDNMNDYYDVSLKEYRLEKIEKIVSNKTVDWEFIREDISNKDRILEIFDTYKPEIVINLAAQAGVRYSITNPDVYIQSNIVGFHNILEGCRGLIEKGEKFDHLIYASSSSVYGGNTKIPFSTDDMVDTPVSLYAATKKSNELQAHSYSKLYNIPTTGLRFFTVYGPAGRPDMAYFNFTNKLKNRETIEIFNYGNCKRDFTYIDDIVAGVEKVIQKPPRQEKGEDGLPIPPYSIYNIGNSKPENLLDFVTILQKELVRANILPSDYNFEKYKKLIPMQPGDVVATYADTKELEEDFDFKSTISLEVGLRNFSEWYKEYYK